MEKMSWYAYGAILACICAYTGHAHANGCNTSSGDYWCTAGFHGGDTRYYTADGDWWYGNWKAECGVAPNGTSIPVASGFSSGWNSYYGRYGDQNLNCGGTSIHASYLNSILCTNDNTKATHPFAVDQSTGTTLNIWESSSINETDSAGRDIVGIKMGFGNGNWAPGDYVGTCPPGYVVTGMAQTSELSNSKVAGIRCSKTNIGTISSCRKLGWKTEGPDAIRGDWEYGYGKMQCKPGEFIKGVAVSPGRYETFTNTCTGADPFTGTFWSHDLEYIACCLPG